MQRQPPRVREFSNKRAGAMIAQDLVDFAVSATRRAGRLTLDWYQSRGLSVTAKRDGSPVTEADYAAERFLRAEISATYPDDTIQGEEEGEDTGRTGRTWMIDPIDGTKAFAQGMPLFSTLLALVDDRGPAVGVIYLPALDECVWAGRGRGTRWDPGTGQSRGARWDRGAGQSRGTSSDGVTCRVSSHTGLRDAYVCTSGLSYWPDRALERVRAAGVRVRTWGDAYGYALVATGRAEAMVDPECFDWDVAPMSVIISEAGGRFSDTAGTDDWRSGSAIATNAILHDDLLDCFGVAGSD